jgi:cold shock CspA family protein
MKYFGTVESFDETKGLGFIKPETTGAPIGFERSGIAWDDKAPPVIGKRLSYEISTGKGDHPAINLQHA